MGSSRGILELSLGRSTRSPEPCRSPKAPRVYTAWRRQPFGIGQNTTSPSTTSLFSSSVASVVGRRHEKGCPSDLAHAVMSRALKARQAYNGPRVAPRLLRIPNPNQTQTKPSKARTAVPIGVWTATSRSCGTALEDGRRACDMLSTQHVCPGTCPWTAQSERDVERSGTLLSMWWLLYIYGPFVGSFFLGGSLLLRVPKKDPQAPMGSRKVARGPVEAQPRNPPKPCASISSIHVLLQP